MSKAQVTKQHIIKEAAALFNQQGYAGCSLSDIMKATGLKKGGIYNHFHSKQELALAAFDLAVMLVKQRYREALQGQNRSELRLKTVIETFCTLVESPPLPGGCPLLNTAIESDDTNPALRKRTQQAMDDWRKMIHQIVTIGLKNKEFHPFVEADVTATIIISTLEGALMMSQLYGDITHLQRVKQHLLEYIDKMLVT